MHKVFRVLIMIAVFVCVATVPGAPLQAWPANSEIHESSLSLSSVTVAYTLGIDSVSLSKQVGHVQIVVSNSCWPYLSFAMYRWLGETYLPIPISNINATDEKANPLQVFRSESQEDGGVRTILGVKAGSAKQVFLRYDISFQYYIDRINSYSGYIGSDYALGVGAFTFLVPSGFTPDRIEVRFDVPVGWTVAAPWEQLADAYVMYSIDDLATATFGLGNFRIFRRTVEGTDLAVATYGGWSDYAKDQLAKYSFTSYEQVVNLFGTNPRKRYLVVYCPPASDGRDISGWAESSQSQGIAVWGGWGWQEGVGWKRPFLHRVIHIWNVFPPFGMQAATRTADWTWWFAEGSADYYAWDRILIKLGVLSSHRILREFFQTYTSQYVGTRYDVPVAEAYQFTREPERYFFLMYRKGALICYLLDCLLQKATAGNVSFDDVMRALYAKFGKMNGIYKNQDILKVASSLSGHSLDEFFKNYIYGNTKLPLLSQGDDLAVDWPQLLWVSRLTRIPLMTLSVSPSSARADETVTITVRLVSADGKPIVNQTVNIYLNSTIVASAITNGSGLATLMFRVEVGPGTYHVTAHYPGSSSFCSVAETATLTVSRKPAATMTTVSTLTTQPSGAQTNWQYTAIFATIIAVTIGTLMVSLSRRLAKTKQRKRNEAS